MDQLPDARVEIRTWAHEARCPTRRRRHLARRRKTKVRDEDVKLARFGRDQDILGLQITVVDSTRVTVFDRVDDLDENALDQLVLSEERELPDDGVKIAGTEVVNEEGEVTRVDLAMEREDMWVG